MTPKSPIMADVLEAAEDLHRVGIIGDAEIAEFRRDCCDDAADPRHCEMCGKQPAPRYAGEDAWLCVACAEEPP